jgi:uncharacterized protein YidB (DUF937 family)
MLSTYSIVETHPFNYWYVYCICTGVIKNKIMFDQILQLVKEHLSNNPQVAAAIPDDQKEAVHKEVASQVTSGLANQAAAQGGVGGLLSKLQAGMASGSPVTNAIEGGLVSSLASKFGLPPSVTGAIAASLPGILQKFAHKATDPNDPSITPDSITKSLSNIGGGILGGLFK